MRSQFEAPVWNLELQAARSHQPRVSLKLRANQTNAGITKPTRMTICGSGLTGQSLGLTCSDLSCRQGIMRSV